MPGPTINFVTTSEEVRYDDVIAGRIRRIRVQREVIEDALGIETASIEQMGEWVENSFDRLRDAAEKKAAAVPNSDTVYIGSIADLS